MEFTGYDTVVSIETHPPHWHCLQTRRENDYLFVSCGNPSDTIRFSKIFDRVLTNHTTYNVSEIL